MAPHVRLFVHQSLRLTTPSRMVKRSVDRPNVYLVCHQICQGIKSFKDLDFCVKGFVIPKTMIFVDDRDEACNMTTYLRAQIGARGITRNPDLITEYTTAISHEKRSYNLDNFISGRCRVLICTEACGMGIDIPDIQRVIQWKTPPTLNLSTLWQRFGRCARKSDVQGVAILMVSSSQVVTNLFQKQYQGLWTDPDAEDAHDVLLRIRKYDTGRDSNIENNKKKALVQSISNTWFGGATGHPQTSSCPRNLDHETQSLPEVCRAISWVINTKGCMRQAILTYFDESTRSSSELNCCHNCNAYVDTVEVQDLIPPGTIQSIVSEKPIPDKTKPARKTQHRKAPSPEGTTMQRAAHVLCAKRLVQLRKEFWKAMGMQQRHIPAGDDFLFSDKELKRLVFNMGQIRGVSDVNDVLKGRRSIPQERRQRLAEDIVELVTEVLTIHPPKKTRFRKRIDTMRALLGVDALGTTDESLSPELAGSPELPTTMEQVTPPYPHTPPQALSMNEPLPQAQNIALDMPTQTLPTVITVLTHPDTQSQNPQPTTATACQIPLTTASHVALSSNSTGEDPRALRDITNIINAPEPILLPQPNENHTEPARVEAPPTRKRGRPPKAQQGKNPPNDATSSQQPQEPTLEGVKRRPGRPKGSKNIKTEGWVPPSQRPGWVPRAKRTKLATAEVNLASTLSTPNIIGQNPDPIPAQ